MKIKLFLLIVLICVPTVSQSQTRLDDQVKPLVGSFKGKVSLFAKNLDTGETYALNPDEKGRLQKDLGDTRNLILRNHGLLTVGKNVSDAFLSMFTLQRACEAQLLAQGNGAELIEIPQTVLDTVPEFSRMVTKGAGSALVWPALLRKMDRLDTSFRN